MSDRRTELVEAFDRHRGFTVTDGDIVVTATRFDAELGVVPRRNEIAYTLALTLPSLDTVVENERVPDVVLDGWAETMERRLEGAAGVTAGLTGLEHRVDWDRERMDVHLTFTRPADAPAPTDAVVALANYVDGTYLQGIIPGYEYGPPVDAMLSQAEQRAEHGSPGPSDGTDGEPPEPPDR